MKLPVDGCELRSGAPPGGGAAVGATAAPSSPPASGPAAEIQTALDQAAAEHHSHDGAHEPVAAADAAAAALEGGWVDVTDALQFIVEGSKLLLAEGTTFASLMGFCDPCPGEGKQLHVAYTFAVRA